MDKKYLNATGDFVVGVQPRTILDVGCGWGALGEFIKDILPDVIIDGMDIDTTSVDRANKRAIFGLPVYRQVFLQDVREFDFSLVDYELYFVFNVFDKMLKEEAFKIINTLRGRLVMCVPIKPIPQGAQLGNMFTERVSFWDHWEIMEFASSCIYRGYVNAVYFV